MCGLTFGGDLTGGYEIVIADESKRHKAVERNKNVQHDAAATPLGARKHVAREVLHRWRRAVRKREEKLPRVICNKKTKCKNIKLT